MRNLTFGFQAFNNITGVSEESQWITCALKLVQIIVDNIRNKTRGLKLEARVGRDKILSEAHTDMELIRTGRQAPRPSS
jgi:hypothetical protein